MKESFIDGDGAVVADNQPAKVAEPGQSAFHLPATSVSTQRSAILRARLDAIPAVRCYQFDPACRQPLAQRIAVIGAIGNHSRWFLPWSSAAMSPGHLDRRERFFREPDLIRGCRVKLLSQRNTFAVDHHHPLRSLAPLGFPDFAAPFFAGAKLPSRNDSLQSSCSRWFSSARNARQMVSQIPCSSQSRSRRQHVAGEGNSSGKSCQRAPLRRIHRIPSSTLRSLAGGLPPRGRRGRFGSQGRIFSHWASVSSRPYRAIGPPLALLPEFISCFHQTNHHSFITLYPVLKQVLEMKMALINALVIAKSHSDRQELRADFQLLRSLAFLRERELKLEAETPGRRWRIWPDGVSKDLDLHVNRLESQPEDSSTPLHRPARPIGFRSTLASLQ
jgi:hypothetical protein